MRVLSGVTLPNICESSPNEHYPSRPSPSPDDSQRFAALWGKVSCDLTSAGVTASNVRPIVVNPISDPASVVYGSAFNRQFSTDTYSDADNDPLSCTASGMPPVAALRLRPTPRPQPTGSTRSNSCLEQERPSGRKKHAWPSATSARTSGAIWSPT